MAENVSTLRLHPLAVFGLGKGPALRWTLVRARSCAPVRTLRIHVDCAIEYEY